jgi:hypothetical protein
MVGHAATPLTRTGFAYDAATAMGQEWREQGPDIVTISQGGVTAARLFGLPFLAVGAWFLYQFLDGVLHPGELTIAGWLMLPAMTAAFLVPGWILMFGRKRTRLEATRREATEEFDYLVFTRRTTTRIPRDAHVMLRYEKGATRTAKGPLADTTVTGFDTHVYLVPESNDRKLILLALFGSADRTGSMEFAQKVSRFLGIDVQDLRFEHGEVTSGGVVVDRLGPEDAD